MEKTSNKPELSVARKLKMKIPAILRSVGDDATSYKGNQQHFVIAIPSRTEVI